MSRSIIIPADWVGHNVTLKVDGMKKMPSGKLTKVAGGFIYLEENGCEFRFQADKVSWAGER